MNPFHVEHLRPHSTPTLPGALREEQARANQPKVPKADDVSGNGGNQRYSAKNSLKLVNFFCAAPQAKSVQLVGDFNNWNPFPLHQQVDGWWCAQVTVPHGHHHYRFVVDGKPVLDPQASGVARDERNEQVSLMAVS